MPHDQRAERRRGIRAGFPKRMVAVDGSLRQSAGSAEMVPAPRVVVVLRKASGERGAHQVEAPDRILRLWAMLDMVNNELQLAAISPESAPSPGHERRPGGS